MKYLLYGHGGAYNHGAEAILKMTMNGLRAMDKCSEIVVSSHFPEQDREFDIIPEQFVTHDKEYILKDKEECSGKQGAGFYDNKIYRTTLDAIERGTVALSIGGDNYCYPVWHRWKCIHEEVLRRGAKDILWSCSINPDGIDDVMRATLASHHLITARESITYEALKEKGLDNVVLSADVAFLLESKKTVLPQNFIEKNMVAINVSPLIIRREKKVGIVKTAILELIEYIFEKTEMNVVLIPHVVMPMDNDYAVLSELLEFYRGTKWEKRICICDKDLSAAEYKYIISQCRLGVFARTHASIAAYSSGIPTLVLGYSVKARGIARDMGVEDYVVNISELTEQSQLCSKFEGLLCNENTIRSLLIAQTSKMKILAEGMFGEINKLFDC